MRISHRELQSCFDDPASWLSRVRAGQSFARAGYARATVLAIYKFHETGDAAAATQHLRHVMARTSLANATRAAHAHGELASYVAWYAAEHPILGGFRLRIDLPLAEGVELGGEVSRLDVANEGADYRAVLLGPVSPGWSTELRMPLLQRAVARLIQRPEASVSVATQRLDGTDLQVVKFGSGDIDEAAEVAVQLALALSRL